MSRRRSSGSSSAPTLLYWNKRGRGEQCRLFFALVGYKFKDTYTGGDEWKKLKAKHGTPWGQVPVLTVAGEAIGQATAILHYVGAVTGNNPADPLLLARCTSLSLAAEDLRRGYFSYFGLKDDAAKKEFVSVTFKYWLESFEHQLGDKPFFVSSDTPTFGDIAVFDAIHACLAWIPGTKEVLATQASLSAWFARVSDVKEIKAYLELPETKART